MNLGNLIKTLEEADPNLIVRWGFTNPHSYRGYYDELAFEPKTDVPVWAMLAEARSAVGATYQGWKGGDYTMTRDTDCWIAREGDGDGETLGPILLRYMLGTASAVSP